jgi:hypothetical protein
LDPAFPPLGVVPVPPFGLGCGAGTGLGGVGAPVGGVMGIGGPPLPVGAPTGPGGNIGAGGLIDPWPNGALFVPAPAPGGGTAPPGGANKFNPDAA